MNILIVRTNQTSQKAQGFPKNQGLETELPKRIKLVKPFLNNHLLVKVGATNTEDTDNVLGIETCNNLSESDVMQLLSTCGFCSGSLPG